MLSIPDMALLGAAALMFFGPDQLPKVARKVGLLVRDVQNTSQTFIREMERAADEPDGGPGMSRAHLLEEPVSAYTPAVHDPTIYGAYDGGSVASAEKPDLPADETLPTEHHAAPLADHQTTATEHQATPPAEHQPMPSAGHQPTP